MRDNCARGRRNRRRRLLRVPAPERESETLTFRPPPSDERAPPCASCAPQALGCEHLEHEGGETVFRHACKMGLEGIVSKRRDSPYRSGRSPDWLKMKNPEAPAVKRDGEEDWG